MDSENIRFITSVWLSARRLVDAKQEEKTTI